jgi:hypothetical protein
VVHKSGSVRGPGEQSPGPTRQPATKPAKGDGPKAKRKRRPVARALQAAAALNVPEASEAASGTMSSWSAVDSAAAADVVQRSVPDHSAAAFDTAAVAALPT